jgi:hypothetical protein
MTNRPCRCGATPTLTEREQAGIQIMQLVCQCRNHGAVLLYTKPVDRAAMQQAAWDGWNLAG